MRLRHREIGMLNSGISPDGLPIYPPRTRPMCLEQGHHCYERRFIDPCTNNIKARIEWFTIRNLEATE